MPVTTYDDLLAMLAQGEARILHDPDAPLAEVRRGKDYRVLEPAKPPGDGPSDTSEAHLMARVTALAKAQGWMVYHTWRSINSEPGFPDLVCVKPGRLLFAELKSRTGKLTEAQHQWLSLLAHSVPEVEVYTWRPADLGTITRTLTRKDTP
jgi:hypothetical protein